MRIIGIIENQKEAYQFSSFLTREGIENRCELKVGPLQTNFSYEIWVLNEEEREIATHWLNEFKKNPSDIRFDLKAHPIDREGSFFLSKEKMASAVIVHAAAPPSSIITRFFLFLCVLLYIWNGFQEDRLKQEKWGDEFLLYTPLVAALLYDFTTVDQKRIEFLKAHPLSSEKEIEKLSPALKKEYDQIEAISRWTGLYDLFLKPKKEWVIKAPLFEKIREGELYRLFTPVLLHGSILHIIFNMLWLWLLGRQVEERVHKWQYLALTLIIGIVSNTAQYLMGGAYFLGYSGIITGFAGFIWVRQKVAPWEGYPLQKGTLIFLAVFVFGMLGIQLLFFILTRFGIANMGSSAIANTAHIVGALTGAFLAKIPFLGKGAL